MAARGGVEETQGRCNFQCFPLFFFVFFRLGKLTQLFYFFPPSLLLFLLLPPLLLPKGSYYYTPEKNGH